MPSRKLHRRIRDILEMSTEIESFIEGMSFADFEQDPKTIKAVLYNLAIIGEAASENHDYYVIIKRNFDRNRRQLNS